LRELTAATIPHMARLLKKRDSRSFAGKCSILVMHLTIYNFTSIIPSRFLQLWH
jgi:hypothetical protein